MVIDNPNTILNGFFSLVSSLNVKDQKQLIQHLSKNIKKQEKTFSKEFISAFGAWEGSETAEELTANIRNARTDNPLRADL